MTVIEDLIAYYTNLLIKQYHDKTKAMDTIEALTEEALSDMVFTAVRDAFDIDTAVGAQLDLIAKYVGTTRYPDGSTDIGDTNLRFLIKMKIAQNACDQTLKSINDYLFEYFGTNIKVSDNKDMSITYQFPVFAISLMTFAYQTKALPRPLGVAIILTATNNPNGDFGFSRLGTADAQVNGYGYTAAAYEGGSYEKTNLFG